MLFHQKLIQLHGVTPLLHGETQGYEMYGLEVGLGQGQGGKGIQKSPLARLEWELRDVVGAQANEVRHRAHQLREEGITEHPTRLIDVSQGHPREQQGVPREP